MVTNVVVVWRWEPRAVWSMELWELAHWARVARDLTKAPKAVQGGE